MSQPATKEKEETQTRQKPEIGEKVYAPTLIEANKTKDLGDGVVEAVVTTPSTDRMNESIATDGVDIQPYLENPIVLYGHDYEGLPIGKTLSMKKTKNQIKAKFQFAVSEYPFAKTVYELVKNGYLNDVSIGGIVKEWSEDMETIEELEMIEFSVVNIGANRDAKIVARSIDKTVEEISKEYESFLHKQIVDRAKGMEDNDLNDTIETLERLVGMLKAGASEAETAGSTESERKIKTLSLRKTAAEVQQTTEKAIKIIKLKE